MIVLLYVALCFVFFVITVCVWRFVMFRNSGAIGLFRLLPASGVHGWRHGVLIYHGEELRFYKLRSLSFQYDMCIERTQTSFEGMRALTQEEQSFMPGIKEAVLLHGPEGDIEFAGQKHAQMALISWIESAPDERQEKVDFEALRRRALRDRGRDPRI